MYIDGRDVGYSPQLALRVKTGKRRIKVVEMVGGEPGRIKTKEVKVSTGHMRQSPLKVILQP